MSSNAPAAYRPQIREMRRSLQDAPDTQITRVVAMVDGLADRAEADALIETLRPRLAQLRPARPLRLARLMFIPLDPVIVPPARWRPGQPALPRSALGPLTDAVREAAPAVVAATEKLLLGRNTRNACAIAEAGAALWPAASQALLAAPCPPSWGASGLPSPAFATIARAVGGLLGQAVSIGRLADGARHGLPVAESAVGEILGAASSHGEAALELTTLILLAELPDPAPVMGHLAAASAPGADAAGRNRAERLTDALLDRLETAEAELVAASELAAAGAEVRRTALLLETLDRTGAPAARRARVSELRKQLDASSRERFESGITSEFNAPLQAQLAAGGELAMDELEAVARGLRQLEQSGRKVGGGNFYDQLVRRTTDEVRHLPESASFTRADKIRMVELLAGSKEAAAMLAGAGL